MYKVGDYVRLRRNQGIAKIDEYNEETNKYYLDKEIFDEWGDETFRLDENDIEDYDEYVSKIIQVGDYVNGYKVIRICEDLASKLPILNTTDGFQEIMEEDINTIITKEEIAYLQYEILRGKNESKNN